MLFDQVGDTHIVLSSNHSVTCETGATVRFSCTTNSTCSIRWNFYGSHQVGLVRLFTGSKLHPLFTERCEANFDKATGIGTLLIRQVRLEDAGT